MGEVEAVERFGEEEGIGDDDVEEREGGGGGV